MAYERILIVGNLGGNPEVRITKDGQQVANLSVAVNRRKGDTKLTTWYRVACWGATADLAVRYLCKGSKVLVEGSGLRASVYLDGAGKPQVNLELNADRLIFPASAPD
jgi:single-strand DNA-binding protein